MSNEEDHTLKSGSSYLFTDKGVVRAFEAFKKLISDGRRGLVITRSHPSRVQQLYSLDCPIMWIAKSSKPSGGVLSLEPTRLMKIHSTISDFIKANPGSVVLSGEMMLRYLGWEEAADLMIRGIDGAIGSKRVTYDLARLMPGATEIKCSEFGDNIIAHMA